MNNLRFSVRSLAKSRGYSLAVVLTLALGIGFASAIFSVVDQVLFRPLPYPSPDQLVVLGYNSKRFGSLQGVYPIELAAYRERIKSFCAFAALRSVTVNLVADDKPMGVWIGCVPVDYFATFGAVPLYGRSFVAGEDQAGVDNVVILSHRFWVSRFNSDPTVVGRAVVLDGASCRVVGVMAPDFRPPSLQGAEVYRPLVLTVDPAAPVGPYFMYVVGRMKPGVTLEQAQAELGTVNLDVGARWTRVFAERTPVLKPLGAWEQTMASGAESYWGLLAAVGLLYAIACANVANLMLARVQGRRKELCIRLAVGGSHVDLIRLVATEACVLTTTGGLLGLLVARWVFPILLWLARIGGSAGMGESHLDWRAIVFVGVVSVATGLLVSIPAAWRITRADITGGLKEGAQTVGESRAMRRFRGVLVVAEAALAMVLLVGAGLMSQTVQRLQHLDRGIDPANKASVYLVFPAKAYPTVETKRELALRIESAMHTVPGVQGVSLATMVPLSTGMTSIFLKHKDGTEFRASWNAVSPGFAAMLGLPVIKGTWFTDARPTDAPVVVINESLARELFADNNPIGQTLTLEPTRNWQVVGVVRDIRERPRETPPPEFYVPSWQLPEAMTMGATVLLRLRKPADAAMNDAVRRAVYAVDPLIAAMPMKSLSETVDSQMARERYSLTVLNVLSAVALGLALLGVFAVMAYTVTQRLAEFGLRFALGAMPEQLFRLVLMRGTALVATGVAIGAVAAGWLTRLMRTLLFETSPIDPLVYGLVGLILILAAILGSWLPARRAMRFDVATLLRSE